MRIFNGRFKPTASEEWDRLRGLRTALERRWEACAIHTHHRLFTHEFFNENYADLRHTWHSVGAQCLNNVTNKVMMVGFSPTRPFMKLEMPTKLFEGDTRGMTPQQAGSKLAVAELESVKIMDKTRGMRATLYQSIMNLAGLGNHCLYLPPKANKKENPRGFSVKDYVVRRTGNGDVKHLIIRKKLKFDELEQVVQDAVNAMPKAHQYEDDGDCCHYRSIERNERGGYDMKQFIDENELPSQFDASWTEEAMPYRVLVWNLREDNDYGTGLVEDYLGDFTALAELSESKVKAALLASQYRWLFSPTGFTKVGDFKKSKNGDALSGNKDDVFLMESAKQGDLKIVHEIAQDYIQRLARGFLMPSMGTRQAERVTAQEIRMNAQELESSFGGTYSQLARDLQLPVARWLLDRVELPDFKGTFLENLQPSIVTGLDGLSRGGDLDALNAAGEAIAMWEPMLKQTPRLNDEVVYNMIMEGHGLSNKNVVRTNEEVDKIVAAQRQQAVAMQNQIAAGQAGADAGAQAAMQPPAQQ